MSKTWNVAVVGTTGAVGNEMLRLLAAEARALLSAAECCHWPAGNG